MNISKRSGIFNYPEKELLQGLQGGSVGFGEGSRTCYGLKPRQWHREWVKRCAEVILQGTCRIIPADSFVRKIDVEVIKWQKLKKDQSIN